MSCSFNCVIIKEEIAEPQYRMGNDGMNTACDESRSEVIYNDIEIKLESFHEDEQKQRDPLYTTNLLEVEITVEKEYDSSACIRDVNSQDSPLNPIFSSTHPVTQDVRTKPAQSWFSFKDLPPKVFSSSFDSNDIEGKLKPAEEEGVMNKEQDPLFTGSLITMEVIVEPKVETDPLIAQTHDHNGSKKGMQSNVNGICNEKRYCCKMCKENCNSPSELTRHMQLIHKVSLSPCNIEKSLTHCEKKSSEQKFACSVCKKVYKYKRGLTSHLKTHFPFKLTCSICDDTFTSRVVLKKHKEEEHTGVKPYSCAMCGKSYNQKYHLTCHLRVHTGDKPFACTFCEQSFTSKYILTYHLRLHTGDKRFSCDFCAKRFIKKCALTNHLRVHTGDKPFCCEICNKCFTQRSTLTDHMRGHRGDRKVFSCEICQKIFYYKSHLNRHLPVHSS